MTNTIFHGTIIRKEGIQYKVNLDTGTEISYVANATSFNVNIGDRVVVSFIGYNNKPVITNVYNKTNNGDIDCRSIEKITKISKSGLIDTYKINYNKPPLESFFTVTNGQDGVDGKGYPVLTSVTSNTISGLGTYTFTVSKNQNEVSYAVGDIIKIQAINSTFVYIIGRITSYTNRTLVINVSYANNSGTFNNWNIGLSGERGELSDMVNLIYPIGSPFFSFLIDEDPNIRFPGTNWVRIEENTYLVIAGPDLVGMTPIGSNNKTLTVSNLPNHNHSGSISSVSLTTNSNGSHTHKGYTNQVYQSGTNRTGFWNSGGEESASTFTQSSGEHTHSINTHGHNLTINSNGSGGAFDNRPKSLAIYMWRRIN